MDVSPVYNLPPGNTYNFGTVFLPYILAGATPDAGPYQSTLYFTGNFVVGTAGQIKDFLNNPYGPLGVYFCGFFPGGGPDLPQSPCNPSGALSEPLTYPTGGKVQVAFWGGQYSPPPVPVPAALPLFATGLGMIGLFGWCKKRTAARLMCSRLMSARNP